MTETKIFSRLYLGDILWVKMGGFPWWPGHIVDPSTASKSVVAKKKPDTFLIQFFGDSSFQWVKNCDKQVHPFGGPMHATYSQNLKVAVALSQAQAALESQPQQRLPYPDGNTTPSTPQKKARTKKRLPPTPVAPAAKKQRSAKEIAQQLALRRKRAQQRVGIAQTMILPEPQVVPDAARLLSIACQLTSAHKGRNPAIMLCLLTELFSFRMTPKLLVDSQLFNQIQTLTSSEHQDPSFVDYNPIIDHLVQTLYRNWISLTIHYHNDQV